MTEVPADDSRKEKVLKLIDKIGKHNKDNEKLLEQIEGKVVPEKTHVSTLPSVAST